MVDKNLYYGNYVVSYYVYVSSPLLFDAYNFDYLCKQRMTLLKVSCG